MPSTTSTRRGALIVSALGLVVAFVMATATPGWTSAGGVMPASAKPHGYSLRDMTRATAPFTVHGNDPAYYPDTPFQILSLTDINYETVGSGVLATGTSSFSVTPGTNFFVPIFNVNDLPPVLGVFPTTPAAARPYFFGQAQYGGKNLRVVVDGHSTSIDAAYLSGPVAVPGDEATHVITLGVFLHPMSVGTHEVRIRGGIHGDLVDDTYGASFIKEDFTYTVEVHPGG